MKYTTSMQLASISAVLFCAGCGGAQKQPESAPSQEYQDGQPAESEQPPGRQPGYGQQPSAAQPPAAGAHPGSARPEGESDGASSEAVALDDLWRDFDRALTLSAPDCVRAAFLRDRICDLSDRVCELWDRNRQVRELADRCTEARSSCERATQRVTHSCP
jgi:hypothetical protein